MKRKLVILVLLTLIFVYGCAKTDELQTEEMKNESNVQEAINYGQISGNIELTENESVIEEYIDNVEVMDESYNIYEVIGNKDNLFIPENEKFWVRADYYNDQTGETDKVYILTDAYLHVFKVLSTDIGIESVISENVLVIRDSKNSRNYHIIDGDGNDISSKYVNDGEIILGVFSTDNSIDIFTVSTEDTYSTQNVIFKVYDENKNCRFSFSKQEINDKYGIEWHCNVEMTGISDLGNDIYCVNRAYDVMGGYMTSNSIYINNSDSSDEMGLYIDMNREKIFLAGKGGNASDGKYIWCGGDTMNVDSFIDIDSETTTRLELGSLKYRDTYYTRRVSNIWNGKFLTNTNKGPLDSSNYAIFNCQGNLICDLESDTVNVTGCSGLYDGYSLIEITNEGGTKYVTVIDENGEWQFEPIQGNMFWHQYIKSTGQFVVVKNDYSGLILINRLGEQEELSIPIAEGIRYDNVIITQVNGGMQYILCNSYGHTVYRKEPTEKDNKISQEDFIIDWQDENLEDAMRQITGITNRDIMLSDVIGIEELDLYFTEVENIDSLKYLTNLRELKLASGKLISSLENDNALDLSALSNLKKLKMLYLSGKKIKDIDAIANLKNLEFLSFGMQSICPTAISDVTPLADLTNLKTLYLPSAQVTNIKPLANLTNLERLDLSYNKITDITPLFNLKKLSYLQLIGTDITDINGLEVLHQLVDLDLGNTYIDNIEPLKGLTHLEILNLQNTDIANLNILADLPQLTTLTLYGATVTDFDTLKHLTHLVSLNLSQTRISDISFLQNLTGLENLYLSDNSITDINSLSNLTKLKILDLTGNPISDYSSVSFVETVYKD